MEKDLKDILLKDLCARLPYGVKVQIDLQSNIYPPISCKVCNIEFTENEGAFIGVETSPDTYNEFREFLCKPYLFPLSSMTKEQWKELRNLIYEDFTLDEEFNEGICYKTYGDILVWLDEKPINECYFIFDYFNKNHFDYRGLIDKG